MYQRLIPPPEKQPSVDYSLNRRLKSLPPSRSAFPWGKVAKPKVLTDEGKTLSNLK